MNPTTADEQIVFDAKLARYIHSVDEDALALMATRFGEKKDRASLDALKAIADSGVLAGSAQERARPVATALAKAMNKLVTGRSFEYFSDLMTSWLTQCAQSNPAAVAQSVYHLRAQAYIQDDSLVALFPKCLAFNTSYGEVEERFQANNGQKYVIPDVTISGLLALRAPTSFAALSAGLGWNGKFDTIPYGGQIKYPDENLVFAHPMSANLVELLLMGNAPKSPESAYPDLEKVLAVLNLDSPKVKRGLTDSILSANRFRLLEAGYQTDQPMWLVAQIINAGAEIAGRDDLLATARFTATKDGTKLDLLSALCASEGDVNGLMGLLADEDVVVKASRRIITEGGVDPNRATSEGWVPLHWAIEQGNAAMVEMLIEHGADTSVKDPTDGLDAAQYAQALKKDQVATMLNAWNAHRAIDSVIAKAAGRTPGMGSV